jgi:hypothetical protein
MTGLVASIQRQQGRAQALQAQCLRMAAWGEVDDFGRMIDRLNGVAASEAIDAGEVVAALAGFGVRQT